MFIREGAGVLHGWDKLPGNRRGAMGCFTHDKREKSDRKTANRLLVYFILRLNAKLFLKTFFVIAILSLLVLMGMNNRQTVDLSMPPLVPKTQQLPAALMYFGFFAVGVLTGTILTAGGKRGKSKSD
jgi:uncharacterized integral membrane protein